MNLRLWPAPRATVGIEVTKSGLHLAAVHPNLRSPEVIDVLHIDTGYCEWWASDATEVVLKPLSDFVQRNNLSGAKAVFSVPNDTVILRYMEMPKMPEKALREVITLELGNTIHLPFENPAFDIAVVPLLQTDAETMGNTSICLIAAPKKLVIDLVHLVKSVGLRPKAAEVGAIAVHRLFYRQLPESHHMTMVAQIYQNELSLSIFIGPHMYFFRHVEALSDTSAGLETYIRDVGYEIDRVTNFFNFSLAKKDMSMEHVILHSDHSEHDTMVSMLSERLNRKVESVFVAAQLGLASAESPFVCAVGLALKGLNAK